ncbi:MAG: hypothetical protein CSA32_03830 [Desulfobulbus propionicus]|nr:MAG: hypothetical protein CSA32_03830 [Desulfobulbus propionicus]
MLSAQATVVTIPAGVTSINALTPCPLEAGPNSPNDAGTACAPDEDTVTLSAEGLRRSSQKENVFPVHQTGVLEDEAAQLSQGEKQNTAPGELTSEEKKQVEELTRRDNEVRTHEQAHKSVGGQYAGAITYTYQSGPDGKRYAVGGEVSIDVSEDDTPEETIKKMEIVRRAALAPAEPSGADRQVAARASAKAARARQELQTEKA